jgi:hypothetical protein
MSGAMGVLAASDPEPAYEVIHLGEHAAAIVPLDELRRLQAIRRHALPGPIEAAELEEAGELLRQHREWVAAGSPGAVSHEEFRRVLLGRGRG